MTTPSASDITALDVTGNKDLAQQWPYLVRSINYLETQIGLGVIGAPQTITLSGFSATGANSTVILVNPQAGVSDELKWIPVTNYVEGQIIYVGIQNQGTVGAYRAIKVNHNAGGDGQIQLATETYFYLNRTRQVLQLQLRGTTWVEIGRSGREFRRYVSNATVPDNAPLIGESELVIQAPLNTAGAYIYYDRDFNTVNLQGRFYSSANLVTNSYTATSTPLPTFYRPVGPHTVYTTAILIDGTTASKQEVMLSIALTGNIQVEWNTTINHPGSVFFSVSYNVKGVES